MELRFRGSYRRLRSNDRRGVVQEWKPSGQIEIGKVVAAKIQMNWGSSPASFPKAGP